MLDFVDPSKPAGKDFEFVFARVKEIKRQAGNPGWDFIDYDQLLKDRELV